MIGWWSHSTSLHVASTRIRGALILRRLAAAGVPAGWFHRKHPEPYRTVVLSKRYDGDAIATAEKLKLAGTRIVVDLCDNRFVAASTTPEIAEGVTRLRTLVELADHVVASTPTLAGHIRQACPKAPAISIIGDLADDLSLIPSEPLRRLPALKRNLATSMQLTRPRLSGRTGLIWFGNHGSPYGDGGMTDLLRIREALETLNREHPLFLTILSNNRAKFDSIFRDWSLPTHYFEWNPSTFERVLRAHAIALIPITPNDFTACKTDNRVVTAFGAGLAVVADAIPSYLPYREAIPLGDWQAGLREYLRNSRLRKLHVTEGRKISKLLNDPDTITRKWIEVLHG